MKKWTLRSAKIYLIRELHAAEQSELQALRHLRNAGQEWINIKQALGDRGENIATWCKTHMPISRQWLDRHAELAKNWRDFLSANKWATEVGYTSRRQSGLEYALELVAAKARSDSPTRASRLAVEPPAERPPGNKTTLSRVRILTGDAQALLCTLPERSVDVCVTSPPYFGAFRDYETPGQIGHEPTVEEYVNKLVDAFRELRRVLRDEGSLWINMGDFFASSATAWSGQGGIHRRQNKPLMHGARARTSQGYKPKDLVLVGPVLAMALQKDGRFLRNEIIWHKKGVRPENVNDRFTRTHEKLYLLTKASSYLFHQDNVREPVVTKAKAAIGSRTPELPRRLLRVGDKIRVWTAHPLGRNGRDIWVIPTASSKGQHPAVFPAELVRRCLMASCPPAGHVIDPFAGSGTTGVAAAELGHTATLIELNPRYVAEARSRLRAQPPQPMSFQVKPMAIGANTTLHAGDCREVMRAIPDKAIDLIIADPPFFLNVSSDPSVTDYYVKQNGTRPRLKQRWDQFDSEDEYLGFLEELLEQMKRVLADDGSAFIFAVDQCLSLVDRAIRAAGLIVLHHIVWLKRDPTPMLSIRRLQHGHETIIWCVNSDSYRFNYRELKMAEFNDDRFKQTGEPHRDVIEASTSPGEFIGHPAQKPVSVFDRLLAIAGKRGGVMLDPCAGSGTAGVAARKFGMRALLIEQDQRYVELIRRRLSSQSLAHERMY